MRGLSIVCLGALSILPIGAAAQSTSKAGKLPTASSAPASAKAPAASSEAAAPAPSATATTGTAPATGGTTSVAPNSAPAASGASTSTNEGSHFTWSTPFTSEKFSASFGPEFGSNDLNLGLGIRGGYTIAQNVYFGVIADYFLGTSQEASFPGAGSVKSSSRGWDVLGDFGYDLAPSPTLVLRPFVGFGIFGAHGEACSSVPGAADQVCVSSSGTKGAGVFGGQVLADLHGINLGGELRLLLAGDTAALIGARVGTTF